MSQQATYPAYTAQEADTRETFLTLMWSMSYPGTIYQLPSANGPFAALADTLLDLETSFFTPDTPLSTRLLRTGARMLSASDAAYHFYPAISQSDLMHVENANPGSLLYPDQAATLILGCTPGTLGNPSSTTTLILRGPGISNIARVRIDGIPLAVLAKREAVNVYPMGWDIFVVDPVGKVIGLPRSAQIQVD